MRDSLKSEEYRTLGNREYKEAQRLENAAPKIDLLKKAAVYYEKALQASFEPDPYQSALKNKGLAFKQLAELEAAFENKYYYSEQRVACYVKILAAEVKPKSREWYDHISACLDECFEFLDSILILFKPMEERNIYYKKVNDCVRGYSRKHGSGNLAYWMKNLEKLCLLAIDEHNLKGLIRWSKEYYTPLDMFLDCADASGEDKSLYKSEFSKFDLASECMRSKGTADDLKKMVLSDVNDYDLLLECLDHYKYTIRHLRELDIETEAECRSCMGQLLHKSGNSTLAEPLLGEAIRLGFSLHPKIVTNKIWFKLAEKYLAEIVEQKNKQAEEDVQQKKKAVIDKHKAKLAILTTKLNQDKEKVSDSNGCFEYLVKEFPPEASDFTIDASKPFNKRLLKAIQCYHPDKLVSADPEKKILFEEIAKILSSIYNNIKGL